MARLDTALEGLLRNNSGALALLGRLVERIEQIVPEAKDH
jgi:hypothetical protein